MNTQGTGHWAINTLHQAVALTKTAQASSTATAYDVWGEKEFK